MQPVRTDSIISSRLAFPLFVLCSLLGCDDCHSPTEINILLIKLLLENLWLCVNQ